MANQSLKESVKVLLMLFRGFTGDEQVIQISIAVGEVCDDAVDEALECLTRIAQTKRHSDEFKQTKRCRHSGLWDVVGMNWNLVIGAHQINLREDSSSMEVSCKVLDVRNWIAVRDSLIVERSVVPTWQWRIQGLSEGGSTNFDRRAPPPHSSVVKNYN